MSYKLVLLRHGESEWNAKNLFTGWVDVPLSDKGRAEATHGGELLKESGVLPDLLFTSMLRRAIMTANLALDAADRHWIPVERNWRLNERHYGALQGKNKKEIRDEYGEEQFMLWRRSFDVAPPAIEAGSEFSQDQEPRYAGEPVPMSECLKDVIARLLPYWDEAIVPAIKTGKTVMIARTVTRCAPSSSTWMRSPTRISPASTSPPAFRWCMSSTRRPSSPLRRVAPTWILRPRRRSPRSPTRVSEQRGAPASSAWTRPGFRHALGRGVWVVSEDPVEACLPWHGRRADA